MLIIEAPGEGTVEALVSDAGGELLSASGWEVERGRVVRAGTP